MTNNPLLLLAMVALNLYMGYLWWADLQRALRGAPHPRALPGATPGTAFACALGIVGAFVIVALETWGELALGLSGEQTRLTALQALFTLAAPVTEELIFRGFIVIRSRGRTLLIASIVGASLLFALLHPYLWIWEGGLQLTLTPKGLFSTGAILVGSLWFYAMRFSRWNPHHSLLPCFLAHFAMNAGVIAVKGAQGFLGGWW